MNSEWATSEVAGLRVATVGDAGASRQVLAFMGLSSYLEPFEIQRFSLLAAQWNARVTIVDTPGSGGGRLTRTERRGLDRGDFTKVARRMVLGAQQHHEQLRRDPVTVIGYSMGASLAAAAAADPGLLSVTSMVLVEPVAIRRWGVVKLLRSVAAEGRVVDDYVDKNGEFPGAVLPVERRGEVPLRQSRRDLAHLGFALRRGRLAWDLSRAKDIQDFTLQIVHGVDSQLSTQRDVTAFIARCRRAGVNPRDVPVGGRHALWHSLSDVAALAQLTRAQWPDERAAPSLT